MSLKVKKSVLTYSLFALMVLFLTAAIAVRDVSVGTDTQTYTNAFLVGASCKCFGSHEIGFEAFLYPMYLLSFSPELIFFVISLLVFILSFFISKKLIDYFSLGFQYEVNYKYYITVFSVFIMVPIVIQVHINAIRQGISALFLLISFLYILEKSKKKSFFYLIVSVSFHYSALLIIPFYILFLYTRIKIGIVFLFSVFLFSILSLIYVLGFSEEVVKYFSNLLHLPVWEAVKTYGEGSSYKIGVRHDFYIFTLLLLLPVFFISLYNEKIKIYFIFLVVSTIPFLLLGWGAYSNRYLFNVWIYIPLGVLAFLVLSFKRVNLFYFIFIILAIVLNLFYIKV